MRLWDIAYLTRALKERQFAVDDEEVRQYFPVDQTLERVIGIFSEVRDSVRSGRPEECTPEEPPRVPITQRDAVVVPASSPAKRIRIAPDHLKNSTTVVCGRRFVSSQNTPESPSFTTQNSVPFVVPAWLQILGVSVRRVPFPDMATSSTDAAAAATESDDDACPVRPWHADVVVYEVSNAPGRARAAGLTDGDDASEPPRGNFRTAADNDGRREVCGHIYLDLFPRDGKFGHQMVVPLRPSAVLEYGGGGGDGDGDTRRKVARPAVCVLGNLTHPAAGGLLRFHEVRRCGGVCHCALHPCPDAPPLNSDGSERWRVSGRRGYSCRSPRTFRAARRRRTHPPTLLRWERTTVALSRPEPTRRFLPVSPSRARPCRPFSFTVVSSRQNIQRRVLISARRRFGARRRCAARHGFRFFRGRFATSRRMEQT